MTRLLKAPKQHDLDEIAHMQRLRRGVETDIADQLVGARQAIEALKIRALMEIAARDEVAQELGLGFAHAVIRCSELADFGRSCNTTGM